MIKGLIITHGNLGKELVAVAEAILEEKVDIECISFDWRGDGTGAVHKVEHYLGQHRESNVIIFTDMFGGSPTNICYKFNRKNIEIITGVNLPGLLKFLTYKDKDIPFNDFVKLIKKEAIEGINIISEFLGEKKK
ncbi:MAG: mannose system component [Acidobacteriota bacterium]|nr:mannose system component [Acidobacteriota bacterium]